jgi:CheY-like chemotaxis protein
MTTAERSMRTRSGTPEAPVSILLVDDDPTKRFALKAVLNPLAETVVEASSGADALRQLLRQEFAVILLDVRMPVMDGFETAHLIRQRPRSELTPIIFVTALDQAETDMGRGYELGAVDFVFAPVVPAILRAKVGVFVDLYRARQELKSTPSEPTPAPTWPMRRSPCARGGRMPWFRSRYRTTCVRPCWHSTA